MRSGLLAAAMLALSVTVSLSGEGGRSPSEDGGSRPAAAQTGIPCPDSYREEYRAGWGIERRYWNDSCQDGFSPAVILREGQRRYIIDCMRDFAAPVAEKKTTLDAVEKLCGQGAAGKARLAKALGLPPPAAAAAESPGPAAGRKPKAMGPLSEAVRSARSAWKADSCLCGMQVTSVYAREDISDFSAPASVRDDFTYYFRSEEVPDGYRIAYRGAREHERGSGANKFNELCVSGVEVDADRALAVAAKQGLAMEPDPGGERRTELRLQTYPKGHFAKWKIDESTLRKMRAIEGRAVWLAVSHSGGKGRTAMIDARTGAVVVVLPRALFLE